MMNFKSYVSGIFTAVRNEKKTAIHFAHKPYKLWWLLYYTICVIGKYLTFKNNKYKRSEIFIINMLALQPQNQLQRKKM